MGFPAQWFGIGRSCSQRINKPVVDTAGIRASIAKHGASTRVER